MTFVFTKYSMLKLVKILILSILVFLFFSISIFANDFYSTFDTVELTEEEKQHVWKVSKIEEINDIDSLIENPAPIINFDVSENGLIVLVTSDEKILVLDTDGDILCAFRFETDGSYYVGWHKDNILLFSVRSDTFEEFSVDGELVEVVGLSLRNDALIRDWSAIHPITSDGNTYTIENRAGVFNLLTAQRYAKLYKTDSEGNEIVLYDATKQLWSSIVLTIGGIHLFFAIVLNVIVYQYEKDIKKTKDDSNIKL